MSDAKVEVMSPTKILVSSPRNLFINKKTSKIKLAKKNPSAVKNQVKTVKRKKLKKTDIRIVKEKVIRVVN